MSSAASAAPSTRDAILRAAEGLFAEHGVEAVPLRQIARAAGQRNVAAVQYHFGDKASLVAAIIDAHQGEIDDERRRRLDRAEAEGRTHDLDTLLSVLVEPLAAKLDDASGRAYLQIQAQRRPTERLLPATRLMALRFARALEGRASGGSEETEEVRNRFAFLLLFHALAERAREESEESAPPFEAGAKGTARPLPARDDFVAHLERALRGIYLSS